MQGTRGTLNAVRTNDLTEFDLDRLFWFVLS
jgi:hypothetical protein